MLYEDYCYYCGYSLHITTHFAGNDRKFQDWNIYFSPLSISIFHNLQIHWAEISFSSRHQGVNDISSLKSMTMILTMIIMLIYSDIVVIWDLWLLICYPPVSFVPSPLRWAQMTPSGGKWKSAGLNFFPFLYLTSIYIKNCCNILL